MSTDSTSTGSTGGESLWEPYTPVRLPSEPPPAPPPPPTAPHKPRVRRTVAVGCLSLVVLLVAGVGIALLLSERLGDNVTRVHNAFGNLDEATRPAPTGALTFLLVGTDSRSENTPAGVDARGATSEGDVVMVARVAPDRKSAVVLSIPRDTLVDIPERRTDRIATAYANVVPAC